MRKYRINKRRFILFCIICIVLISAVAVGVTGLFNKAGIQIGSASEDNKTDDGNQYGDEEGMNTDFSEDDRKPILVNSENEISKDYKVSLAETQGGHKVDKRIVSELNSMLKDCEAVGLSPLICSSYRTYKGQGKLLQGKIDRLIAEGYAEDYAEKEAMTVVARPGTSEHQLGLAVDIVDMKNQLLDESQEKTKVQRWLMKNSWKYGFILRYPNDKKDITKVIYEPWHYRYVGKAHAKAIYERGICLEEYIKES